MTSRGARDIRVYPSLEKLGRAAAEELANIARAAARDRDRFTLVLPGGQTPRLLYQLLAREYRALIPWQKTEIFWGDERYLPPDHPHSNYRMAKEVMLDHLPIPRAHLHPMPTLVPDLEEAAEAYEETLRSHFPGQWPRFDLILLGMGPDGHIASLFPHNLVLEEEARVVAAVREERAEPPLRLTLTLPAINHAANVHFLIAGANKAAALARSLSPNANPKSSPAAAVKSIDGQLVWWVDEAAAARR